MSLFTKWKTFHGAAININTDLNYFSKIIPCGIDQHNKTVINLSDIIQDCNYKTLCGNDNKFNAFTTSLIDKLIVLFERHFNIKCYDQY